MKQHFLHTSQKQLHLKYLEMEVIFKSHIVPEGIEIA